MMTLHSPRPQARPSSRPSARLAAPPLPAAAGPAAAAARPSRQAALPRLRTRLDDASAAAPKLAPFLAAAGTAVVAAVGSTGSTFAPGSCRHGTANMSRALVELPCSPRLQTRQQRCAELAQFRDTLVTARARSARFSEPPSPGWRVGGWVVFVAGSRRPPTAAPEQCLTIGLKRSSRWVPQATNHRHGSGAGAAEGPLQGDTLPA